MPVFLHKNTEVHIPASPVRCAASLDQIPPDKTVIEETDYKSPVCTNLRINQINITYNLKIKGTHMETGNLMNTPSEKYQIIIFS